MKPPLKGYDSLKGLSGNELLRGVKAVGMTLYRCFSDHECLIRASALSFTTILSFVPVLALTFAVLKGLGVQNLVEPFILDQVAAGSRETVSRIVAYINNTNMKTLGAAGVLGLVFTTVSLIGSIEEAFNVIWGVAETRTLLRKFSDYFSILFTAPLLVLTAVTATTTLQSQQIFQWLIQRAYLGDFIVFLLRLLPYLSIWVALVFMYMFLPNTRVKLRSAILGGILAGTLWQGAQWGYVSLQVGVSRYNAIYGTLATLPIFMVWIYISWIVVLAGMEVVHLHQNPRLLEGGTTNIPLSYSARVALALECAVRVCRSFLTGAPAPTTEALASSLEVVEADVAQALECLCRGGFIVRLEGEGGWQPSRAPSLVRLSDLLRSLGDDGNDLPAAPFSRGTTVAIERVEGMINTAGGEITLQDLAQMTAE